MSFGLDIRNEFGIAMISTGATSYSVIARVVAASGTLWGFGHSPFEPLTNYEDIILVRPYGGPGEITKNTYLTNNGQTRVEPYTSTTGWLEWLLIRMSSAVGGISNAPWGLRVYRENGTVAYDSEGTASVGPVAMFNNTPFPMDASQVSAIPTFKTSTIYLPPVSAGKSRFVAAPDIAYLGTDASEAGTVFLYTKVIFHSDTQITMTGHGVGLPPNGFIFDFNWGTIQDYTFFDA